MIRICNYLNLIFFTSFYLIGFLNLYSETRHSLLDSAEHYKFSNYKKSIDFARQIESDAESTEMTR
jgi:hypothetical protein